MEIVKRGNENHRTILDTGLENLKLFYRVIKNTGTENKQQKINQVRNIKETLISNK